jgi:hypothetical protein
MLIAVVAACGDDETTKVSTTTTTTTTSTGANGGGGATGGGGSGGAPDGGGGSGGAPVGGGGAGGGACLAFGSDCAPSDTCCDVAGETGQCYSFGMGDKCTIPCPANEEDCPNNGLGCNNMTPSVCRVPN